MTMMIHFPITLTAFLRKPAEDVVCVSDATFLDRGLWKRRNELRSPSCAQQQQRKGLR